MASALYLRGIAKLKSGEGGDGDLAAAQTLDPKIAQTFEKYGMKP